MLKAEVSKSIKRQEKFTEIKPTSSDELKKLMDFYKTSILENRKNINKPELQEVCKCGEDGMSVGKWGGGGTFGVVQRGVIGRGREEVPGKLSVLPLFSSTKN